jgi:hypothetical protein
LSGLISISPASDIPKTPFHLNEKIEKAIGLCPGGANRDTLCASGSVGAGGMAAAIRESSDELKKTLAACGPSR